MTEPASARRERRKSPRRRVLKGGKAIVANQHSVIDCTIRDVSDKGARLACGQVSALPPEFLLVFVTEHEMRDVRVVWRAADELGVEFVSPPRSTGHLRL